MARKKQELPQVEMTQSRLNSFLSCERKEWFEYRVKGVGVKLAKTPAFFLEGEFGHYALKHWYKSGRMLRENMLKRIKKLIEGLGPLKPEEADDYDVRMAAMIGAAHGYKTVHRNDPVDYEVIKVEEPFVVEVGGRKWAGRIDLIVKEKLRGTLGFFEHKFLPTFSVDNYVLLPLNVQELIYCHGFKSLMGQWPDWYRWNIVRKSLLRRKGTQPKKDGTRVIPENMIEYEARVAQQYIDEPEKMFMRTPPRKVEERPMKEIEAQLAYWGSEMDRVHKMEGVPPMRFPSCTGMYRQPCPFVEACTSIMSKGGEGWDAPECRGTYKLKEAVHEELVDDDEED